MKKEITTIGAGILAGVLSKGATGLITGSNTTRIVVSGGLCFGASALAIKTTGSDTKSAIIRGGALGVALAQGAEFIKAICLTDTIQAKLNSGGKFANFAKNAVGLGSPDMATSALNGYFDADGNYHEDGLAGYIDVNGNYQPYENEGLNGGYIDLDGNYIDDGLNGGYIDDYGNYVDDGLNGGYIDEDGNYIDDGLAGLMVDDNGNYRTDGLSATIDENGAYTFS